MTARRRLAWYGLSPILPCKAVAFPTDAKLMHRARERLVKLARKTGVSLRQSYERIGKYALIAHQRYTPAKQFKRANRALKTIRTYLGRVVVNPSPQPEPLARHHHGHLVRTPSRRWPRASTKFSGKHCADLQNPSTDRLVGDIQTALRSRSSTS